MIVVVGGGVIGLSVAWYLARSGAEVLVCERGAPGQGCTWGSAGWITPSEAAPVIGPSVIRQALASVGRPSSPLYLRPTLDLSMYSWMLRALRYANSAAAGRGLRAVAELARPTFELYDELEQAGLGAEVSARGLLHVFARPGPAARSLAGAAVLREYGYQVPGELLTGAELRELEPALSRRAGAGYLIREERHVDPARLVAGLAALVRKAGAEVWEQTAVRRLEHGAGRVRAVVSGGGTLAADAVVLAGGVSSLDLLRPLGLRLPLTAGKGYSFLRRVRAQPRRPIHFGDVKVAMTPLARGLRVAGTMELSGDNEVLRRSRLAAIARDAAGYLDGWDDLAAGAGPDLEEQWVGRRPLTPDGLPILDRVPAFANLYLATGHSMLGITLAPASGRAMARYVTSGRRPDVLGPFRLSRFAGR